jgi:hypothetical protein
MLPLLIALPAGRESESKRPLSTRNNPELTQKEAREVNGDQEDEERCILTLVSWYFVLLILPAILAIIYLILNPDAFMINVKSLDGV